MDLIPLLLIRIAILGKRLKNGSGDMKTLRYGGHNRILLQGLLII